MPTPSLIDQLISNPRPLIVDIWAPWCAPCRWMAPMVERLKTEYEGRVDVWKVNTDEQPEAVRTLGIIGIPTLVAFGDGKEIMRKVGAGPEADLRSMFEAALLGEKPARPPIAPFDRLLRLAAGTAIIVLAISTGPSALLLTVGGIILFTAVPDHCPIWQAIRPRITSLFSRGNAKVS